MTLDFTNIIATLLLLRYLWLEYRVWVDTRQLKRWRGIWNAAVRKPDLFVRLVTEETQRRKSP